MRVDLLIFGQGLAGTLVAWQAHWRGLRVAIVDPGETETASRVAAGIINPITGRRLSQTWRLSELFPAAETFYARVAGDLGQAHYRRLPILRGLDLDGQPELWQRRLDRNDGDRELVFAEGAQEMAQPDPDWFSPMGARFSTRVSGQLRVEAFLEASRDFFETSQHVVTDRLETPEQIADHPSGVAWNGIEAEVALLSTGAAPEGVPRGLKIRRARGDVLQLALSGCPERRIVNRRGKWFLPPAEVNSSGRGIYLAGSTYDWDGCDPSPTKEGRRIVENSLAGILAPEISRRLSLPESDGGIVVGHRSAFRPVVHGSRLVAGRDPIRSGLAYFNGLGSKGVLNAPLFAGQLVDHLFGGAPLDPEINLDSYLS